MSKLVVVAWLLLASLLSFGVPPHAVLNGGDLPGIAGTQPENPDVPPLLLDRGDEETSRDDLDEQVVAADAPLPAVDVPQPCCQQGGPARGPSVVAHRVMTCIGARGPPPPVAAA